MTCLARIHLIRRQEGASAVEFGLIAPIFLLMLVATIDLGLALFTQFQLNGAVSAAANYAILNASSVNSTSGSGLALNLAKIISNQVSTAWANATVTVNNGPTVTATNGAFVSSGTAANADSCYCPTLSGTTVVWTKASTCGATCSNGSLSGKFISITASKPFTSVFGSRGLIPSVTVVGSMVVETN